MMQMSMRQVMCREVAVIFVEHEGEKYPLLLNFRKQSEARRRGFKVEKVSLVGSEFNHSMMIRRLFGYHPKLDGIIDWEGMQ